MGIRGAGAALGTTAVGMIRGTGILGITAAGTVAGMAVGTAPGTIRGTMADGAMAAIITTITTMISSARGAEGFTRPVFQRQAPRTGAESDPLRGQPVSEVHQQPEPEALPGPQGLGCPQRPQDPQVSAEGRGHP